MKDGVYFNLSEEEYHEEKRLSASGIKQILNSPTEYWFNSRLNPLYEENKSEALTDGTILHGLILEPEKFFEKFAVPSKEIDALNKNTNTFKEWKAANEGAGKKLLTLSKYQKFKTITAYLSQKGQVLDCGLFKGGRSEVSIFWTEGGIKRKARLDYVSDGRIIDLKTFAMRQNTDFSDHIRRYFYSFRVYIQMIYYLRAFNFAKAEGLPVKGTQADLKFWEGLQENPLLFIVFINRDLPQGCFKAFLKEKCPDLWRMGENQIEKAEMIYSDYMANYGDKSAWLQDTRELAADAIFTDEEFPQSFYERLKNGGSGDLSELRDEF